MDPLLEPVRVMSVEDWAEIRRLHRAERMSIKAIVRKLGISRNAVRRALAASGPPRYERPARGSRVDAVEPQIRALLQATPTMPATVIAERIGWEHGLTVLKERVAVLRPFYLPPDPASRTTYDPGDRVQCDLWEPPVDIPLGWGQVGRPPVLVFTSGYSRMRWATMVCSKQAPDLIAGHWTLWSRWAPALGSSCGITRALSRLATRQTDPDTTVRGVPRQSGYPVPPVPAPGPRGEGPDRAEQRLLRNLVPARPTLRGTR